MFENLKQKYAHFVVRRKYLRKGSASLSYNKILSDAIDFFIIMPAKDNDFYHSLDLLKYYLIHKKVITIFLPAHKYNLIPEKEKYKFVSFLPEHINRVYLPGKNLIGNLSAKEYDVVIDLNRSTNIFYSAVANIVKSKVRVGFRKNKSEGYYNLVICGKNEESEAAYRSFLSYLKMF